MTRRRALVAYESMFGNTRRVAEVIAEGIDFDEVSVEPISHVYAPDLEYVDLFVLGGPTHMLGMSGPGTRAMAVELASRPASRHRLEPDAAGSGVREWLTTAQSSGTPAAAFDTRLRSHFAGSAAPTIRRLLAHRGFRPIWRPVSFSVSRYDELLPGELVRARTWGRQLARAVARADHRPAHSAAE